MWSVIKNLDPIWYFDSTGSIIKNVKKQNKPLLFSIVSYDKKNHKYVPVAEFVTTNHTSVGISQKLFFIKKNIEFYSLKSDIKPKIIVVDYSWALINSILEIFCETNNSIARYLIYCYDFIVVQKNSKEFSQNMIKIYICATHFLKNLSKKAQALNGRNNITLAFVYIFTLLQNAKDLSSFQAILKDVYIVLNNKNYDEQVASSFKKLRNQLRNRKFDCQDVQCFYHRKNKDDLNVLYEDSSIELEDDMIRECANCMTVFQEEKNIANLHKNLKQNSPFKEYFENYLCLIKISMTQIEDSVQYRQNKFYSPVLFKLIKDQLHIVPLWTGIIIHKDLFSYQVNTRLTNNPVEKWFGFLKHSLLNKRKNVNASELISPVYKNLLVVFLQFYQKNIKIKEQVVNPKRMFVETWEDNYTKKKKKGALFYENFELDPESDEDTPEMSNDDEHFLTIFEPNRVELEQKDNSNRSNVSNIFYELKLLYEKYFIKTKNLDLSIFTSKKIMFDSLIEQLRSKTEPLYYGNEIVDKTFDFTLRLNDLKDFKAIDIERLGNCFYQSISKLIFGDQKYFYLIRLATFYTFYEYRDFFSIALEHLHYGESVERFIQRTYKDKAWANEILIAASSISLKRSILSFSIDPQTYAPNNLVFSFQEELENPLIIVFHINHFAPLMRTTKFPNIPIIKSHLLKDLYSILKID